MMQKAFHVSLGVLVAFSVWCAALVFAVLALRVLLAGGLTVYHLLHS